MKRRFWNLLTAGLLAAASFAAMPALAALTPGAKAPDFTAEASLAGKDFSFSLQSALNKGPVVVYFYPAAYTGGCDIEAHTFATQKDAFDKAGATIIGVSADSLQRLNVFSADPNYCAGKFPVASDPEGKIAATYGLKMQPPQAGLTDVRGQKIDHGFLPRTTFVLDRSGKIVATFSSATDHISPAEHVSKSLAIVQRMQAKHAL